MKVFLYTTIFSDMSIILPFPFHFYNIHYLFRHFFDYLSFFDTQRTITNPPQSRPSHHPPHPHNHCRCHIGHNHNRRPCRYRHIRHHTNHRCFFRSCSSLCLIIPAPFEPLVRSSRATLPAHQSHTFR